MLSGHVQESGGQLQEFKHGQVEAINSVSGWIWVFPFAKQGL